MNIKKITYLALSIALICVATMIIQIPIPQTHGFVHFGDGFIFLAAAIFGIKSGVIAGAIGSMLADILSGYLVFAPVTFIVKALTALVFGLFTYKNGKLVGKKSILGSFLGSLTMVLGYFIYEAFVVGVKAAFLSSIMNMVQGAFAIIVFIILKLFEKINLKKILDI